MKQPIRVALLIETSTSYGIEIVKGVDYFARMHGDWLFYLEPWGRYEQFLLPAGWTGDGVIARVKTRELAEQLIAVGLPAVNVSWYNFGGGKVPSCSADEQQSGRVAAEHFLDRGFRRFAYVGSLRRPKYVDRFGRAFGDTLRQRGCPCLYYKPSRIEREGGSWYANLQHLCQWLQTLPKPIAVLTFDSERGRQVTDACHQAGIRIPDAVAVLGGEQEDLSCQLSRPPLSTVDLAPFRIGYEAASLLAWMMADHRAPREPVRFPPGGVITRQSTDTLAIDDPFLVQAIRFIREHGCKPIHVGDVLRQVPLARRVLELRFQTTLGRSPAAEIRREQWAHATDGPVRIAPVYAKGKVYFGSDDGHAYCVRADDGSLLWKSTPSADARRILHNGRLIPLTPCRTGVLVHEGTAYFATGMLPWEPSYLCALDAETGKPEGPGRYVKPLKGPTLEGALLASANRLFSPQGRIAPLVFDRRSGTPQGSPKEGGGGCFALIVDENLLHGPGNKTGWITQSSLRRRCSNWRTAARSGDGRSRRPGPATR